MLAEITNVCDQISDHSLEILSSSRFELRAPYSFTRDKKNSERPWVGPVPILEPNGHFFSAAFDLACGTRGPDSEADEALNEFTEAAKSPNVIDHILLKEGDNLIINNRRCAHGRTAFYSAFDGNDRWLQRLYIRRSIKNLRPLDPEDSLRIF